jgi:hypothetical protein
MPSRGLTVLTALAIVAGAGLTPRAQTASAVPAAKISLRGLKPGTFEVQKQRVPIEIVLIGFSPQQVRARDVVSGLPESYTPLVRYPQFYGLSGRNLGLEYDFRYQVTRRSAAFENDFFAYLSKIGFQGNPTGYQLAYNNQQTNVVDVTGPVLYIEGPKVEKWLVSHDTPMQTGYRIYFVNWYGRSDFKFHVYIKFDEPDPDTQVNFGFYQRNTLNSWGGGDSRTWIYDFSAGPEWNTTNWVVDAKDLDGDGVEEYRMPPVWEYAANGYRSPSALSTDIGLLTRYVAVNLLFTTSPLYDPMLTTPGAGGRKVVDITMFEDDPGSSGTEWINPQFAKKEWRRFQPYYNWVTGFRDVTPIDPGAKAAFDTFAETNITAGCWQDFGDPFAALFCYFRDSLSDYVPAYRKNDYVAPVFAFNTTLDNQGAQEGLLGFADDNWVDGTQSYVFAFDAEEYREVGYGFTGTVIHEVGHHIGLSHPHDGYDSETGNDYGPDGPLFFAWAGDESATVMHYLTLTNRFGQHNRDNMYRWEAAGYLNWSNALVADILASPDAAKVTALVQTADTLASLAKSEFRQWHYLSAVEAARGAYVALLRAADQIGVESGRLEAARRRLPEQLIRRYVCKPRQLIEMLRANP